jgi:putative ABC transport system substrate-binding protein
MSYSPVLAITICLMLTGAAAAQPLGKTARIGMLCGVRCAGAGHTAFYEEMRKLGWIEGQNLVIERREAGGQYERLPALAAELVQLRPDLIVATATPVVQAAKAATPEIPIVFGFVGDPVGVGLVRSLSRPGGNVTGVTTVVPGEYFVKTFETLRELLPLAQRVAVLTNPANATARVSLSREIPIASQHFGLHIEEIGVRTPEEIPGAVAAAKQLGVEALLIVGESVMNTPPPNRIPDLVAQVSLPAIYQVREAVEAGGLIGFSQDTPGIARRWASSVDRVLRGTSPADMPIEQPTKYDLVVNLKTARALGLTVPPSLLARADEVIE